MDPIFATFTRGTYYNPAWKHYGKPDTTVICDRCNARGLSVSIGWESTDLCMSCVDCLSNAAAPAPTVF